MVAAVGMAACTRRGPDPCASATFSEQACQDAVRGGGYYWHGSWVPMVYSRPYPYYYDSYRQFVAGGGHVSAPSATERGGFGSIGASHGSAPGE